MDPFPQSRVEEFDVTFMAVDEGYDANVVARPLSTTEWILCASPAYLQRAGTPRQPQDLAQHEYLKFPRQQGGGTSNRRLRLRPARGEGEPVAVMPRDSRAAASSAACVDLPAPSPPSKAMNSPGRGAGS